MKPAVSQKTDVSKKPAQDVKKKPPVKSPPEKKTGKKPDSSQSAPKPTKKAAEKEQSPPTTVKKASEKEKPQQEKTDAKQVIQFSCRHCDKLYKVPIEKIPRDTVMIKCKACGRPIPVDAVLKKAGIVKPPAEPESTPAPKDDAQPIPTRKPAHKTGKKDDIGGKTCVKCGYQRQPKDDQLSSADSCPRCGLLYDRSLDYLSNADQKAKPEPAEPIIDLYDGEASVAFWRTPKFVGAMAVLLIVIVVWGMWPTEEKKRKERNFLTEEDFVVVQKGKLHTSGHASIATGSNFTAIIKSDGTVWGWGNNQYGQLGNGTTNSSSTPIRAFEVEGIISISAGSSHLLALDKDGTVRAWGDNRFYQLGDGTATGKSKPVTVKGLTDVKMLSAGLYHSMALLNNGKVMSWGSNKYGQLGNGANLIGKEPAPVKGLDKIVFISCGQYNSAAVKNDGTVWMWGQNYPHGMLGDGTTENRNIPVQVTELTKIASVSIGAEHVLALRQDQTVWSWGINRYGQLGYPEPENTLTPLQIKGLSKIISVVSGDYYSKALDENGDVWVWGYNIKGRLGDGTNINKSAPEKNKNLKDVISISGQLFSRNAAITKDLTVLTWGDNEGGLLGDGTAATRMVPVPGTYYEDLKSASRAKYTGK